jgi:hypothetical protein
MTSDTIADLLHRAWLTLGFHPDDKNHDAYLVAHAVTIMKFVHYLNEKEPDFNQLTFIGRCWYGEY